MNIHSQRIRVPGIIFFSREENLPFFLLLLLFRLLVFFFFFLPILYVYREFFSSNNGRVFLCQTRLTVIKRLSISRKNLKNANKNYLFECVNISMLFFLLFPHRKREREI